MFLLYAIEAWWALLLFDCLSLVRRDAVVLWHRSIAFPDSDSAVDDEQVSLICRAVDEACIFYFHRVLCLQRSAVATALLRRRRIPARLTIGYRPAPLESHAWVEVRERIVNDLAQYRRHFTVISRL